MRNVAIVGNVPNIIGNLFMLMNSKTDVRYSNKSYGLLFE